MKSFEKEHENQKDGNETSEKTTQHNLDTTELIRKLSTTPVAESTDIIIPIIQDEWNVQLEKYIDENKLRREEGYAKRVEELEEELKKCVTDAAEKEHNLNEQITMWKEKTKIKQQNFVQLEDEIKQEIAKKDKQIDDLNSQIKKKVNFINKNKKI